MTFDERIYNKALNDGMPQLLSTFIVAQARHETGNYTSNVFKTCNNAFGYKYVGQNLSLGPCTGSPENDNYAKYSGLETSVQELTAWIKRRQNENKFPKDLSTITTPDKYAALLKQSGYYGASEAEYLKGLVAALLKIGEAAAPQTNTGLFLILLALGIVIWRKRIFP